MPISYQFKMKSVRVLAVLTLLLATSNARGEDKEWAHALEPLLHSHKFTKNLDPILKSIGVARLVLLGEASHGTSQFYTWRAEISKRLITEKGFSFIAVEGDWASLYRLNRYVKGLDNDSSAREILLTFDRWPRWMWANEETMELAEWLRDFNKDRPLAKRVGFYGMDVYGWENSLTEVVGYLQTAAPQLAKQVQTLYAGLARHGGDVGSYARAAAAGQSSAKEVAMVVKLLREASDTLIVMDSRAYFNAEQNALVVKNAEEHIRKMMHGGSASWNARVEHMDFTVVRLKEFYGEKSRGIVWAHNTHIGDARATNMAQDQSLNIGQLARQRLGEESVFLLGFTTHHGDVLAARSWGGPRATMATPPAQAGSVEALLNKIRPQGALIIFRGKQISPALRQPRGHRAIGVIYHPEREAGNYVPTILPQRYDAFIFLPRTNALRALHEQ